MRTGLQHGCKRGILLHGGRHRCLLALQGRLKRVWKALGGLQGVDDAVDGGEALYGASSALELGTQGVHAV